MSKVILGFTMWLDGFINDRDGSVVALYPDLDALRYAGPLKESIRGTGAVVMLTQEITSFRFRSLL